MSELIRFSEQLQSTTTQVSCIVGAPSLFTNIEIIELVSLDVKKVMLNIRKPPISETNVMNKDTLKTTLKKIINSLVIAEAADEDVNELLKQVLDEIKAISPERNIIQGKISRVENKLAAQEKPIRICYKR